MQVTEAEIVAILHDLPQPALEEAKVFIDFLAWRYRGLTIESRKSLITTIQEKVTADLTTDEVVSLAHSEDDYILLAQEGLRTVYDQEPDGLWEQCLES
jgi:hypothetical protein